MNLVRRRPSCDFYTLLVESYSLLNLLIYIYILIANRINKPALIIYVNLFFLYCLLSLVQIKVSIVSKKRKRPLIFFEKNFTTTILRIHIYKVTMANTIFETLWLDYSLTIAFLVPPLVSLFVTSVILFVLFDILVLTRFLVRTTLTVVQGFYHVISHVMISWETVAETMVSASLGLVLLEFVARNVLDWYSMLVDFVEIHAKTLLDISIQPKSTTLLEEIMKIIVWSTVAACSAWIVSSISSSSSSPSMKKNGIVEDEESKDIEQELKDISLMDQSAITLYTQAADITSITIYDEVDEEEDIISSKNHHVVDESIFDKSTNTSTSTVATSTKSTKEEELSDSVLAAVLDREERLYMETKTNKNQNGTTTSSSQIGKKNQPQKIAKPQEELVVDEENENKE